MALGSAFIEIHADLRPFVRQLDRQVKRAAETFEKELNKSLRVTVKDSEQAGKRIGDNLGDGVRRGLRDKVGNRRSSLYVGIASALASALDDGISALPREVKAGIVAGLIAALPIVGGGLAGALIAGIGAGVAGLGILLAAQFEAVQTEAVAVGRNIRNVLVSAAGEFEFEVVQALQLFEGRIEAMEPALRRIFDVSSRFVIPLTEGGIQAIEAITDALDRNIGKIEPFVNELSRSIAFLGFVVGDIIDTFADMGEEGQQALRDLIFFLGLMIMTFADMLAMLARVHGALRDFATDFNVFTPFLATFVTASDNAAQSSTTWLHTNTELVDGLGNLITMTKGEEDALKEATKAMQDLRDATFDSFQANIDFERSLNRVREGIERNGNTLNIKTEEGRRNLENIKRAIMDAQEAANQSILTQERNNQQALQFYRSEIEQLKEVARRQGITNAEFDRTFGKLVELNGLPITPGTSGLNALAAAAKRAADNLQRLIEKAQQARRIAGGGGTPRGGIPEGAFADGDIITRPTFGLMGEAGPEVVIPLTKPARAAELAQKSGLTQILGNAGMMVQVFIGNEQLDARMVQVVQRANTATAVNVSQGPRRF